MNRNGEPAAALGPAGAAGPRVSYGRGRRAAWPPTTPSPLLAVQHYLAGLLPYLETLHAARPHQYALPGIGRLTTLRQAGHRLLTSTGPVPGFTLSFERVGEQCLVTRPHPALLPAHRARLASLGLESRLVAGADGEMLLVPARVPVTMRFHLGRCLTVTTTNFHALGPTTAHYAHDAVDDAWLQALARCILYRPDSLASLPDAGEVPRHAQLTH